MTHRLASLFIPVVLAALASGCGSGAKTKTETAPAAPPATGGESQSPPSPPGTVRVMRYNFDMVSPANDDFAITDPEIFIYIRPDPDADHLVVKVQGREQNHIKILWNESEFVDILGRRYQLVPPSTTIQEAANGIVPPTDIPPGGLFSGKVLLLDPADIRSIRALGGKHFPIVPHDAGTPEQIRDREFTMRLAIELNASRRDYEFLFAIQDIYFR
jgi:hypothetical protein